MDDNNSARPMAVLNPNSGEVMLNMKQIVEDNSADARRRTSNNGSHDNAWESLRFTIAHDAQTLKHLATLGIISAGQTGVTENQAAVGPVRTATGDAIVGGVGVSAEQVSANVADLATAIVPVISTAIANAVATAFQAILPALITAVGGSSTPSQTQPKPAA